MDILPDRLAWYITGPLMGLCVVALYALANKPLGATTAYSETIRLFRGVTFDAWRVWLLIGFVAGALVAALLGPGIEFTTDYGDLGRSLPLVAIVPFLVAAGVVMGYGARWSGGCTSGHGLRGSASLSPASLVATGTFMAVAIAISFALNLVTGGDL